MPNRSYRGYLQKDIRRRNVFLGYGKHSFDCMNIKEKFDQYPPDMQQWMIQQEKTKLTRIKQALEKGKTVYTQLKQENQGKWLEETIQLLEQYLNLLPSRDYLLEEVSDNYILQVWERLENDSSLYELISQVETRYEELLKIKL
ncbi:MAG: hypothetical protein ACTMUB_00795 [cyanobacterium endosymbiont of Rhopalodia musculus]|uniref:hypothetical protein n=1 Tax=cyanobacterium endosymbiont of Epithemia clementina EcSB TaxID=3034674 RepID=UPI00248003F9|nr:hypothetical protein [cyanobacterium endosymbiont of Epithemia clementina EcSB]WGT66811.1 hypothetical protein P3F56_06020 [cyanobacterium endosymbiont of Epithemia clementina EcSB]